MKTLKVKLKQHTPLIHFQPDQQGATLRASEVKPKLDRFIITQLGSGKYEAGKDKAKEKKWLIGNGEHPALDYKLRIEAQTLEIVEIEGYFGFTQRGRPNPAPMFFGNMENEYKQRNTIRKKFSKSKEGLNLVLFSRKDDLIAFVSDYLYEFFMQTNFGTRQSKGYGSFSWDDEDWKKNMELKGKTGMPIPAPKLPYFISENEDVLFPEMEWFSKAIRSGINDCFGSRLYMKSLMFAYAKSKHQQWEKKTIKSVFYDVLSTKFDSEDINELEIQRHSKNNDILVYTSENEGAYLFKDCLGLSTVEKWKKPVITADGRLDYDGSFTLEKSFCRKEEQPNIVQRMKSPILLKPIKQLNGRYRVYIMYNTIPQDFLNSEFNLKVDCCAEEGTLHLQIYSDFSLKDYFDFLFKRYEEAVPYRVDIANMISTEGRKNPKGQRIINMFKELRETYCHSIYR